MEPTARMGRKPEVMARSLTTATGRISNPFLMPGFLRAPLQQITGHLDVESCIPGSPKRRPRLLPFTPALFAWP